MRVDFYTLERREFGQAKRARTLRERTALTKPTETLAFRVESEATKPPHQSSLFYRTDSFLTPTPKMQAFPGTPAGGSLIRPLSFISYRCVKKTWKRFLLPRFWQKSRGMKSFAKLFQKRKINFQKLERYVLCRERSVSHYTPFDLICQQRASKVNMPKNAHCLLCKTRKFWDFGAKKAGWKGLLCAV